MASDFAECCNIHTLDLETKHTPNLVNHYNFVPWASDLGGHRHDKNIHETEFKGLIQCSRPS